MTEQEQFTAINKATFMQALVDKAKDTMATLGAKGLRVDAVEFDVTGVPCKVIMPKGGNIAHISVGTHDDAAAGPIIDMPQVPVGWVTPTA